MRILLAIDNSTGSDAAIAEVCQRPWPAGSEVRVVTVLSPLESLPLHGVSRLSLTSDEIFEQQGWEAASRLNDAATHLQQRTPGLHVTPVLLEGRPKDAILDEAERWGADLIVVGSYGSGVFRRFFLGSVSLAVALHAPCSVEIVRRAPEFMAETM